MTLGVVVALVLALGGGGMWALTRSSDPLSLAKAPILKVQQDLSDLGTEPTAASLTRAVPRPWSAISSRSCG